jgi:thiosulfate/3-mercaptopyruvate sulfurtransferase
MRRQIAIVAAMLAAGIGSLCAAPACGGHGTRESLLVSGAWLSGHLQDPNLVILAVGNKPDYDAGHIPGSLYLDPAVIRAADSALTLELRPIPELVDAFSKLGISSNSRIVLYTNGGAMPTTTRVLWTLDAMGLGSQTSMLDGGFAVWKSDSRAISKDVRTPKPGTLAACPQTDVVVDSDYVKSNLKHAGVAIVDARLAAFYSGERPGNGKKPGHIPGASNVPFDSIVDDKGNLKSPEALQAMLSAAGVKKGDRVVSYCHIGQQATALYFVARYLGYDARLYDGSFEDWSGRKDLPVETTK